MCCARKAPTSCACLTIVDRLEGAKENFAAEGLELRAIYTADEFLKELQGAGADAT